MVENSCPKPVVLTLECISESPGGHVKTQMAGPTPRVFDPLGVRPQNTSNKFLGNVHAAGPGATL